MKRFECRLQINFDKVRKMEPSLVWALEKGLLTDKEAIDLLADELEASVSVKTTQVSTLRSRRLRPKARGGVKLPSAPRERS